MSCDGGGGVVFVAAAVAFRQQRLLCACEPPEHRLLAPRRRELAAPRERGDTLLFEKEREGERKFGAGRRRELLHRKLGEVA